MASSPATVKIRASSRARFGYEGDLTDLKFLARKTQLKSIEEAQAHLEKFFDDEVLPLRAEEALNTHSLAQIRVFK